MASRFRFADGSAGWEWSWSDWGCDWGEGSARPLSCGTATASAGEAMLSAGRDAMGAGAVMQGEVGGRGLVGMNFDDDKAGGKLEVRRAVVASAVADGGWGKMGDGGVAGLDWTGSLAVLCSFFPGATRDSSNWGRRVGRQTDPGALADYSAVCSPCSGCGNVGRRLSSSALELGPVPAGAGGAAGGDSECCQWRQGMGVSSMTLIFQGEIRQASQKGMYVGRSMSGQE